MLAQALRDESRRAITSRRRRAWRLWRGCVLCAASRASAIRRALTCWTHAGFGGAFRQLRAEWERRRHRHMLRRLCFRHARGVRLLAAVRTWREKSHRHQRLMEAVAAPRMRKRLQRAVWAWRPFARSKRAAAHIYLLGAELHRRHVWPQRLESAQCGIPPSVGSRPV